MNILRGEFYKARFPHAAGGRGKKRPVLVVQADDYNQHLRHAVVAQKTANLSHTGDSACFYADRLSRVKDFNFGDEEMYKKMVAGHIAVFGYLVLSCCGSANAGSKLIERGPTKKLNMNAQSEIQKLLAVDAYRDMIEVVSRWQSELNADLQKEIVVHLLRNLPIEEKLKLHSEQKLIVVADDASDGGKPDSKAIWLRQDVFSIGGRCAWALEQILHCTLPIFRSGINEQEKQRHHRIAYESVIAAMSLPNEDFREIAQLGVKERSKLAEKKQTSLKILRWLARDVRAPVRLAVAHNRNTPVSVLAKLLRDPDPHVRAEAVKALIPARQIK